MRQEAFALLRPPARYSFVTAAVTTTAALALTACGGDGAGAGPEGVIDSATLDGVESGKVDLAIKVRAQGEKGGNVNLDLSGPFRSQGQGELPLLDVTAKARGKAEGEPVDFDGGLVLLPSSGYASYEGVEYAIDSTTFGIVESAIEQGQREAGGEGESGATTACQEELGELAFSGLIVGAKDEGRRKVGGESTRKVSGELDVPAALEQAVEVAESPACSAQVGAAGGLPSGAELEEAEEEARKSVRSAKVELYVGEDDIVRRLVADLTIVPKERGEGRGKTKLNLDLRLTGVNRKQRISEPEGPSQPLSELFLKLDVNPVDLLDRLQGKGKPEDLDLDSLLERLIEAAR